MTIRLDQVTVMCDDTCPECTRIEGPNRCIAETTAILQDGIIQVHLPPGWSEDGEKIYGPNCTEYRALQKVDQAELPDPSQDPPALRNTREVRLATMKEVVRADLEEREAKFPELREFMREIVLKDGDVPDFLGHIGNGVKFKTEVRVRGNYVEISWPGEQSMSLTLKHDDLKLVDPPAFMDRSLLDWVQNCLLTMGLEDAGTVRDLKDIMPQ